MIVTKQEMEYSCQQNHHSMACMAAPKAKSKSRFLSLLLLCFLIFCFTTQASALALDTRTNAQPTASHAESDTSKDHSDLSIATRRAVLSKRIPSLKNREPKDHPSSHDMIEVRSEKAQTAEEVEKVRLPREVGKRTTEDEDGDGDKGLMTREGPGEKVAVRSFRIQARK